MGKGRGMWKVTGVGGRGRWPDGRKEEGKGGREGGRAKGDLLHESDDE